MHLPNAFTPPRILGQADPLLLVNLREELGAIASDYDWAPRSGMQIGALGPFHEFVLAQCVTTPDMIAYSIDNRPVRHGQVQRTSGTWHCESDVSVVVSTRPTTELLELIPEPLDPETAASQAARRARLDGYNLRTLTELAIHGRTREEQLLERWGLHICSPESLAIFALEGQAHRSPKNSGQTMPRGWLRARIFGTSLVGGLSMDGYNTK